MQVEQSPPAPLSKYRGLKPFKKGNDPRRAVRKAQVPVATTAAAMVLLVEQSMAITQKVIDKALAGDNECLRMCMDRIIPVRSTLVMRTAEATAGETPDLVAQRQEVERQLFAIFSGALSAKAPPSPPMIEGKAKRVKG